MWKSGGLRVALAGVVAVVLAGGMAVEPAWAGPADPGTCLNGSPDERLSGNLYNQLNSGPPPQGGSGTPYYPGCSAVLAFDSNFTPFIGTCTGTSYSVDLSAGAGAVGPNILVIVTWATGSGGTPPNQPETFVFSTYVQEAGGGQTNTCTQDFTANSGPLAVTINRLTATGSSGSGISLALVTLSLAAAALMIGRRRLGKRAPDA